MKSTIGRIICLFLLFFSLSMILCGCEQNTIDFNRESPVQNLMNGSNSGENLKTKTNSATVKESSGVIIYKDNSTTNSTGQRVKFGPEDLNFEFRIK